MHGNEDLPASEIHFSGWLSKTRNKHFKPSVNYSAKHFVHTSDTCAKNAHLKRSRLYFRHRCKKRITRMQTFSGQWLWNTSRHRHRTDVWRGRVYVASLQAVRFVVSLSLNVLIPQKAPRRRRRRRRPLTNQSS